MTDHTDLNHTTGSTEPAVPHRFELTVEVPGTAEQVWHALATAEGLSAWMMPTELEERDGGTIVFHMGPGERSEGRVTAWEPPRRLAYAEDWATLAGQDPATVTPLVSEFLVEARSGGTCVVRVVSSAFGTGAEWEQEFFDNMAKGWAPMFDHLRLYLTHFAGQRAAHLEAVAVVPGTPSAVAGAMRRGLGVERVGQVVEARGLTGQVERVADESMLLRATEPVPGIVACFAFDIGDGTCAARVGGYLFSDEAAGFVEREQPAWQQWLDGLAAGIRA